MIFNIMGQYPCYQLFSKILEKLMYNRLLSFFEATSYTYRDSTWFIENKSTETASQSFTESVQEALDNREKAIGIFLDLSKAYDVINHKILLYKLDLYGVRGTLNGWFKSYLTGRTQVVEISYLNRKESLQDKLQSTPRKIENGVPQGSILGPLLSLLYINDLPDHINDAKLVLFADDTNILVMGKNEEELNTKISVVTKQLDAWLRYSELV